MRLSSILLLSIGLGLGIGLAGIGPAFADSHGNHGSKGQKGAADSKAAAPSPSHAAPAPKISPADLKQQLASDKAPVVIDVRSTQEYESGHIPGAVNIPFQEIAERIDEIETPNGVALYCMVGPRARKGEAALKSSGYTQILHIDGGLRAWTRAGFEVAKGSSPGKSKKGRSPK